MIFYSSSKDDGSVFLSIIIPAYNEEKNIETTISSIEQYMSKANLNYEILVVDDGSSDCTNLILEYYKHRKPHLRLIRIVKNRGKGYALRIGLLEATGKFRLFMDADHSTNIAHLEKVLPLIKAGFKVIVGTRSSKDLQGAQHIVPQCFLRRIIGKLGNILIQLLILPGIWDTQCGFKLISADVAK